MDRALRSYRKDRDMTLDALSAHLEADGIKISVAQLSRIEREGTHSLPTAMKLAEATSLPVESFAPVGGG